MSDLWALLCLAVTAWAGLAIFAEAVLRLMGWVP